VFALEHGSSAAAPRTLTTAAKPLSPPGQEANCSNWVRRWLSSENSSILGRQSLRDVKQVLAQQGMLPADMYYELGGLYQQQQIAFKGLIGVFIAALALVFVLLLFLYGRFRVAIAILLMPLLALGGVFTGLWLTGTELNITAMMGMTMIVGIVTEVSVFYFSELYEQRRNGLESLPALVEAGRKRLRPITMTTLAAMLALLPLAMALGQGSAMQQPLAIAIIAGLLVQLPLVLIAMPVVFHLLKGDVSVSDQPEL